MRGMYILFSLLPLAAALVYDKETPHSVRQAFIQSGLVPDILASFNPVLLLDVTYTVPETGQQKAVASPGMNFTTSQTLNSPAWSVPSHYKHLANQTFAVAMVDPDVTPTVAQIRHFVGGNFRLQIPPSAVGAGAVLVNSTPALSEYVQPAPRNTSESHRYAWLLYRQTLDFPTSISANITGFNISAFAQEFGLGQPLAGNYMTVSTNSAALAAAGES